MGSSSQYITQVADQTVGQFARVSHISHLHGRRKFQSENLHMKLMTLPMYLYRRCFYATAVKMCETRHLHCRWTQSFLLNNCESINYIREWCIFVLHKLRRFRSCWRDRQLCRYCPHRSILHIVARGFGCDTPKIRISIKWCKFISHFQQSEYWIWILERLSFVVSPPATWYMLSFASLWLRFMFAIE